ncbi:L-seryl-tRNA(Sec) selenium transferase [Metabacillus herbersteinensis]|uniref:L-seryl-tRNA(Sec) selenium transferase n=1 Tax=Metabacillus herbersteinensis TaxID=283816 RepID=A0ABV6GAD6_9BACI
MKKLLRELPAIHLIQKDERFHALEKVTCIPSQKLIEWTQKELNYIRKAIIDGECSVDMKLKEDFLNYIFTKLKQHSHSFFDYTLKEVINATGTILHTNLGRARLSDEAIKHVVHTARNYSNLEYDLEMGKRGSRHTIIESTLIDLTGAEAAMVVNNNAAAVYLILCALAKEKEVIVSRGELVEIGGSFRISSIMEESGAILKEVGTTNKTHLYDYEQSINEETSILMKVHTSNFKTIGFTHTVGTAELVELANQHNQLIVYEDLGSGALYDFPIGSEPVVSRVLKTGVDIVSFSGDKLLGGPQAGIIIGKKELIEKLKKHQMARVLRVDKMTLAALEATVKSYIQGKAEQIPTIRDILLPLSEIRNRIDCFIEGVSQYTNNYTFTINEETSQIGGGTMPGVELQTLAVAASHPKLSAQHLFDRLRLGNPAIITRVKNEKVILDFRTVTEKEIPAIINSFLITDQ